MEACGRAVGIAFLREFSACRGSDWSHENFLFRTRSTTREYGEEERGKMPNSSGNRRFRRHVCFVGEWLQQICRVKRQMKSKQFDRCACALLVAALILAQARKYANYHTTGGALAVTEVPRTHVSRTAIADRPFDEAIPTKRPYSPESLPLTVCGGRMAPRLRCLNVSSVHRE